MIDDKKIEEASSEETFGMYGELDSLEQGFICGAHWAINEFLKDLWHPASEEPEIDKPLIIQYISLMNEVSYDKDRRIAKYPWKLNVEGLRIIKWCYFDDLLPKGGDK